MNNDGFYTLARALIDRADPDVLAASSFDNFHARGLLYLNLLRAEDLTCKPYVFQRGWGAPNADGLVVNPHTHAYAFHSTVLVGETTNVIFRARDGSRGSDWYDFTYRAPLNGGNGFTPAGQTELSIASEQRLVQRETYYLNPWQIHSIRVPANRTTVLFLCQYRDERKETEYFSREAVAPNVSGLYTPISPARFAEGLALVRGLLA